MTTVVYQGTQPLDSRFLESTMLKLKVPPHPFDASTEALTLFDRSWGSIQSLYSSKNTCPKRPEPHPVTLNFELCTETLGDENGTDFCSSNTLFLFPQAKETPVMKPAISPSCHVESTKARRHRKSRTACDLPPPLTSLSGSDRVRLSSRRENGKLVIEAVRSSAPAIHVQRTDGRIVMSMMVDPVANDTTTSGEGGDPNPDSSNVTTQSVTKREDFSERKPKPKEEDDDVDSFPSSDIGSEVYRRPTRCKDGDMKKPFVLHRFWVTT